MIPGQPAYYQRGCRVFCDTPSVSPGCKRGDRSKSTRPYPSVSMLKRQRDEDLVQASQLMDHDRLLEFKSRYLAPVDVSEAIFCRKVGRPHDLPRKTEDARVRGQRADGPAKIAR